MEIVEIIALILAWIFTLAWMYGSRIKPVVVSTAIVSLTVLLVTTFITFFDGSKLHGLWAIPLAIISFRIHIFIMVHIPLLSSFLVFVAETYLRVIRVGMSKSKLNEMYRERSENVSKMLNDLAKEKLDSRER